jgi:CheY-like chemotaxis protein
MYKILIADDDARIRGVLRQIMAGVAGSVCEARDGDEAVAVCAAERPDWVIMDWRMKPLDGLRATAAIKTRFPDTRIILLSPEDDTGLRAEATRAGVWAFVLKDNLLQLPEIVAGGPGR